MLSITNRLKKLQTLKNHFEIRSYTTATISKTRNEPNKKESLYSRISPLGDPKLAMTPELDNWVQKGFKVRLSEVKQIIHDLRKRRRFHHALEVSEWMNKKGMCAFTPTDHAVQLDLIGKVHGFVEAEKYFNALSEEDKNGKTYGALLHCYVRQRETDKSLSHFEKMKEKGFVESPVTYNDIMCLYIHSNETDKVLGVLKEMKMNGVNPDNLSYRMCINSYGDKLDIEGMEKVLSEMEKDSNIVMDWNTYAVVANCYIKEKLTDKANSALMKAEKLVAKDGLGYNHLISLHARLGNKEDVLRLWGLQKTACKRQINRDYTTMVKSLVRIEEFEEAEKLLVEWKSSGNVYDFQVPLVLIDGYLKKDLSDKAKDLLDNLVEEEKATTPDIWGRVAKSLVRMEEFEKAEKLLVKWNSSGNAYDFHQVPLILIDGYLKKDLPDKAKDLLDNLWYEHKVATPDIWGLVADSFLKKGDVKKAISCMDGAITVLSLYKDRKLDSKIVYKLLKGFGEKASINEVQDVKLLVLELRRFMEVDRGMHHAYMKAYMSSDKDPVYLCYYMEAHGIKENEETRNILKSAMKK